MQKKNSIVGDSKPPKTVGSLKVQDMATEYGGEFKDKRLVDRACKIGVALAGNPNQSLPKLLKPAELEGAYRLLNNDVVHWRQLFEPHRVQTLKRCAETKETVLAIHDTTDVLMVRYNSDRLRTGMVSPSSRTQGMRLHVSFAVSGGAQSLPLGSLRMQPFVHKKEANAAGAKTETFWESEGGLFDNEMRRWFDSIEQTNRDFVGMGGQVVHVADCECASFGLMTALDERSVSFIFRSNVGRRLQRSNTRTVGNGIIELGARGDLRDVGKVKTFPARTARTAKVTIKAGQVTLQRATARKDGSWSPDSWEKQPRYKTLNLVEVEETESPKGEPGVRWLLLTTLPVDTAEQVLQVVEWYRRRWVIEEFFKALKTGCSLEKRQMDSARSILNMTALLLPVAWRLLALRSLTAEIPDADWSAVLTPIEFEVLRIHNNSRSSSPRYQLSKTATVAQCLAAVARLGGHLPNNGRPGWQTLYAGWQEMSQLVEGAMLMKTIQKRRR